jgi:uncharacterized membrane protein
MNTRAAITVLRACEEIRRLWDSPGYGTDRIRELGATVDLREAPGDRGTEIHVDLGQEASGPRARLVRARQLARVKDDLRRFKQRVETGVIPRSDASPEGERAERKLKQRPAQPLDEAELAKVGAP